MPSDYRLVVNCGTREKDLAWMTKQAKSFDVELKERSDLAMIAVQGPDAITSVKQLKLNDASLIDGLAVFQGLEQAGWMYCRTGYTGEDGLEILLPNDKAESFWNDLLAVGVKPCGLGARDTLRLEAGMNLYGSDMDESVTPLESNMAWTVSFSDDEIGEITSGSFSPTLGYSVALARVEKSLNDACQVDMRGKQIDVKIVKPPFVRFGKQAY